MCNVEDKCNDIIELLNFDQWIENSNIKRIEDKIKGILNILENESSSDCRNAAQIIIEGKTNDNFSEILKYSVAIAIFPDINYVEEFCEKVLSYEQLTWQNLFFLYNQINHIIFMQSNVDINRATVLCWKILQKSLEKCMEELSIQLNVIPKKERNPDFAVVLTAQYILQQHGPTKTTLDRSMVLKNAGKEVLIINTAELLSSVGSVPFYNMSLANYITQYENIEKVEWKGISIPFFQCENNMPDIPVMEMLLQTVMSLKPGIVILIGGSSLLAGLIDKVVPVLGVGLTESGCVAALTKYQAVEDRYVPEAVEMAQEVGLDENTIIPGRFTFSFMEQKEHCTREQFGISKDSFVLVCVGGRLTEEITDEFIEMIEELSEYDIVFAIIGIFDTYDKLIANNKILSSKSINFGFCEDVFSRLELCDLYVNPPRNGGGTSSIEAMYMGKPVVTIDYGDVSGSVGEEFRVRDYEEMKNRIIKYITDKQFYEEHSKLAKKKAEELLDSQTAFMKIIDEYIRRG